MCCPPNTSEPIEDDVESSSKLFEVFSNSFRVALVPLALRSLNLLESVRVSTALRVLRGACLRGHAGQEDQQKRLARSLLASLSAHEMGFLQGGHHLCRSNVAMAHGPDLDKGPKSSQMTPQLLNEEYIRSYVDSAVDSCRPAAFYADWVNERPHGRTPRSTAGRPARARHT